MRIFLLLLLTCIAGTMLPQDNLGIAHSNYSPANTVLINPSSIVDNKAFIDIHLVGVSTFVRNNLVYLPKEGFTFSDLWNNPGGIPDPAYGIPSNNSRAYADVNLQLLSASFAVGKNSFAFTTQVRSVTDARRIPDHLANYIEHGLQWEAQMGNEYSVRNMSAVSLNWAEVGLSYGRIIKQRNRDLWTAGVSLKYLMGIAGGGIRIDRWDYAVVDSTNFETYNLQGEIGFNSPNNSEGIFPGRGLGADLGVTFKRTKSGVDGYIPHSAQSNCRTSDYIYKLGISILDIGSIGFNKPFYGYEFDIDEEDIWQNYPDFDPDGEEEIASGIGNEFAVEQERSKLKVKLPTAFSIQYDQEVYKNVYLGGHWIQGLPRRNSLGPQRASQLAFIPRFEAERFEASMPLILHEYSTFHMGLMLRLNSIIIGTDNLGTYLFNQDVYGADVYVSVKYTIFRNWNCPKRKRTSRGGRSVPPCATW